MTTVASGRCTSAPVPVAIAIGMKPSEATSAVMSTGRRRVNAPSRIAASSATPSSRSVRMYEIITNPLSTATPESAMNPTAADIDIGMSRSHKARMPPVNAKGMPVNTSRPSLALPNMANSSTNTSSRETGTTICRRLDADCRFSKVPPQLVQ
jgi:hypothetical protein